MSTDKASQADWLKNPLKKKKWTGKEVGKLLIACLTNDIAKKEPLLSQTDFEKIERSLTRDEDHLVYGVYRDIYDAMVNGFNRGSAFTQLFSSSLAFLCARLKEVWSVDNIQKKIDEMPLIMTEGQYKRLKAEAVQALSERGSSFGDLVFHCLNNFLESENKAPEPIKEALAATKKIPATGNRFLQLYNDVYKRGYYSLPDGRRSDQMTEEEWKQVLKEEFLKCQSSFANGKPATIKEVVNGYSKALLEANYESFFKGMGAVRKHILERTGNLTDLTDEELTERTEKAISVGIAGLDPDAEEVEEVLRFGASVKWNIYEEPPAKLVLYDLLRLYLEEFRGAFKASKEEALRHFKKDVPTLYDALKKYIEEKVPQARGLKASQLHKDIISYGELAKTEVVGCRDLIRPSDAEIVKISTKYRSKHSRVLSNGIAILKNPVASQMDENGDYVEQESWFSPHSNLLTLDETDIAILHNYVNHFIYPALSYIYAFNSFVGIIGKVYDVPELVKAVCYDMSAFERQMESFNRLLYGFYYHVCGTSEEQERKRTTIKRLFRPLEADILKPLQEAVKNVTAELVELGFSSAARKKLKYPWALMNYLINSNKMK